MKKFLVRTAVAAGAGAMMMLGTAGAASAVSLDIDPDNAYYGIDLDPAETGLIAKSGVGGILGFVPGQLVVVVGTDQVVNNVSVTPWSPAVAQNVFNDSASRNGSISIGIVDPREWGGRGLAILQVG